MVQLQQDLAAIEATGTRLAAISFDTVETLKTFADANGISYSLLSDAGSKTIHAYGIHHQNGYPHPGTYLIDQQGIVQAAIFVHGYRKRHENAQLIEAARQME